MQQGEVPGFSRTMRWQMRERWDSTAFHLFLGILPSGFPLSIMPSRTRFFVIFANETDGWILDLFADGPGSSIAAVSPESLLEWAYPARS